MKQQGFWFSGEQFGGAQASSKIYDALCGDSSIYNRQTLKEQGRVKALELFEICIKHEALFQVFRHNIEAAFNVVNDEWGSYVEMAPGGTEKVVKAYMKARRDYVGQRETTQFAHVVDRFIVIWDRVTGQAQLEASEHGFQPPQQLQLSLRPLPSDAPMSSTQDTNLASVGGTDCSTKASWPPAILSPEELRFLVDSRIRRDIFGISSRNRPKSISIPDHRTSAIDIKTFLCLVALSYFKPPDNNFALFMTTIAFLDSPDRRHAFKETEGKSKIYGTVDEFVGFARSMLNNRARQMVVGLLTDKAHYAGKVLILRLLGGGQGTQFIFFDPSQLAMGGFRMGETEVAVTDKIGGPSAGISEAWWGGYQPELSGQSIDPVNVASQFLLDAMSNRIILPIGEGRDVIMESLGFHKLVSQQYPEQLGMA